jgi:cell division septation protein DedD
MVPPLAAQAKAAPAPAKGYRLQLGAMRTQESAQQEWQRLQHQHGDVLGKLAYAAPRVDLGSRGVFYRIQAGPIAAAADASRACNQLKQRGVSCLLVKP